jgi:hypothetical protein
VQSLDLPAEITQDKLCEEIQRLNGDKTVWLTAQNILLFLLLKFSPSF